MADIPFSIGGEQIRCPNFEKSKLEPGGLEYQYLNGALLYLGGPVWTFYWDFLLDDEVAAIRMVYEDLVNSIDPITGFGTLPSVTVPDYLHGGLRATTGYITEPTGAAGGDGTKGFTVMVYNLHEATLLSAMGDPDSNLWEVVNNGGNIEIGSSTNATGTWQF
jgi:hypothetical protein